MKKFLKTTSCACVIISHLFASGGGDGGCGAGGGSGDGSLFGEEVQAGLEYLATKAADTEDPNTIYKIRLPQLVAALPELRAIAPDFAQKIAEDIEGTNSVRKSFDEELAPDDFHDKRARRADCTPETKVVVERWARENVASEFAKVRKAPEGLDAERTQAYLVRAAFAYYGGWREAEGPISFMGAHMALDETVLGSHKHRPPMRRWESLVNQGICDKSVSREILMEVSGITEQAELTDTFGAASEFSAYQFNAWESDETKAAVVAAMAARMIAEGEARSQAIVELLTSSGAVHSLTFTPGEYDPIEALRTRAGADANLSIAIGLGRQMPGGHSFASAYSGVRYAKEALCGMTPVRTPPQEIDGLRVIDICDAPGHATDIMGTAGGVRFAPTKTEDASAAAGGDERPRNPFDVLDGLGDGTIAHAILDDWLDLREQFLEGLKRTVKAGGILRVLTSTSQMGDNHTAKLLSAEGSGFILTTTTPAISPDIAGRMTDPPVCMNFVRTEAGADVADVAPLHFDEADPSLRAAWDAVLALPTE